MANIKIDIHQNKLELKLKKVPVWNVPESTKQEIFEYVEKGKIGQITQGRRLNERTLKKKTTENGRIYSGDTMPLFSRIFEPNSEFCK